jgi:hypothetical protein
LNARHTLLGLLVIASSALGGSNALANTVPGAVITGTINTVNGNSVNIGGHVYPISAGSPAAAAAAKLAPGQYVDVQLDGPANSSASRVINIVVRHGN